MPSCKIVFASSYRSSSMAFCACMTALERIVYIATNMARTPFLLFLMPLPDRRIRQRFFPYGGVPAGTEGGTDDGKECVFRVIVLFSVEEIRECFFKIDGSHCNHLKAIIGDKVGLVNI